MVGPACKRGAGLAHVALVVGLVSCTFGLQEFVQVGGPLFLGSALTPEGLAHALELDTLGNAAVQVE